MRVVKNGRYKVFEMESVHAFVSSISMATVTFLASLWGAPISTTHVFALTIVGVGSSKRLSAARWGIAKRIIAIWILTIPTAAVMGAFVFFLLKFI
jgi:PiT family inorganic phosphate transporter